MASKSNPFMFVVQFHILNNQHFTAINFLAVQMAHGPLLEFFNISVDPQTNTIALFFKVLTGLQIKTPRHKILLNKHTFIIQQHKMHKYTLNRSTKILVLCICSNILFIDIDILGETGIVRTQGCILQGPCKRSHLHNSPSFTGKTRNTQEAKGIHCLDFRSR